MSAEAALFRELRPAEGLRLSDLAREIPGDVSVRGDGGARVFGVHHDSRRVEPGDLFVARRGARTDGVRHVGDARARGAAAILVHAGDAEAAAAAGLPSLVVDDAASGLAYAAAAVYGHPAFSLDIVGITGTNGKTTVSHLVRAAIDADAGAPRCGLVGTVGHSFGPLHIDAAHTTPEADELARVLALMRRRGATHAAMEVSSIALVLGRVKAVRFRAAVFTNLTQDHLDFHGSMDAYGEAKARLFVDAAPGSAVVHVGDPFGKELARRVRGPLIRVTAAEGAAPGEAEVLVTRATLDARGIDAELRTPRGPVRLRSRLVGRHNLENLAVTIGVACALELDLGRVAGGLAEELGAPGRLERCDGEGDDVTVAVDYAHTPDALARVLDSARAVARGRLLCVFGCGGDRDAKKRGPMGEAVASRADVAIVTNDNPRTEDPRAIARPIEEAIRASGAAKIAVDAIASAARGYAVELDRAAAIRAAILSARPGDVVIVAGKGHEDYQVIGAEKRPFDDRVEARAALAERRASSASTKPRGGA